ncbi:hypothetical protein F5051DRAFT_446516 [Lentinula edodes]|nr:hypothetical protein F5051DRAFT_446516 [Lentinula edodes]
MPPNWRSTTEIQSQREPTIETQDTSLIPENPEHTMTPPQQQMPHLPEPIRRSEQGHVPSRRYLESEEYGVREKNAQENGKEWSTEPQTDGQPLTLISQNPFAFAASSGDLWVLSATGGGAIKEVSKVLD